jgi:hypothetical protein
MVGWSKEKKWSLWRSALYGLIAAVIRFVKTPSS